MTDERVMTTPCEAVAERLALGEPLEPLAEHVASCAGCTRLVEMPRRLGAARHDIDPGLGFSARMTVGAQHRIAVRRRRRVAAGLAATMAAGALGVVVLTREPDPPMRAAVSLPEQPAEQPRPAPGDPADLQMLVNLADTGRSLRLSASWRELERPLGGYQRLVEEVQLEDPAAEAAGAEAEAAAVEGDAP
jgi:hypothetical protein